MDEVPGAWSLLGGEPVKLFQPEARSGHSDTSSPGVVLQANPDGELLVASGNGAVALREVQPTGRRRMLASDWIRGRSVVEGDRFE
jgi:methionyl-tRNA formyltransferase